MRRWAGEHATRREMQYRFPNFRVGGTAMPVKDSIQTNDAHEEIPPV